MFGPWSVYGFLLVGVLFVISMFRSAKAYGGSKSGSLALMRGTFAVGLIIALVDTGNDLSIAYVQNQYVPPPMSIRQKIKDLKDKELFSRVKPRKSKRKTRSSRRRSRYRSRPPTVRPARSGVAARTSTDRKYEFLYGAMGLSVFLYILCQPHTWNFVTNFLRTIILAFKGIDANAVREEPPPSMDDSTVDIVTPPEEQAHSAMEPSGTSSENTDTDSGH